MRMFTRIRTAKKVRLKMAIQRMTHRLKRKSLIHVNIAKVQMCMLPAVMKCPQCLWCDNCKICPICEYKIPLDRVQGKDSLQKCYDCGAMTLPNLKTLQTTYYPYNTEMDKDDC